MLTNLVYNCEVSSLGDVTPFDFVQVFEAQMKHRFAGIRGVRVTFTDGASRVVKARDEEGNECDPATYSQQVGFAAETAWAETTKAAEYHNRGIGSPVPPYDPEEDGDYSSWLVFNNID